jgi:TatD DNase family protein
MHCFVSGEEFAKKVLDLGFKLSFTGIITFPKTDYLSQVVKNTPLEKMMIETDCPYLAPQSYRGSRNEPAYVVEVAKKIAEIKNISLAEVENTTTKNAVEFFKLT